MSEQKSDDDMTPDERLAWLRERGVLVETPEERRANQVANALGEAERLSAQSVEVSYVLVPADSSQPLKEIKAQCPSDWKEGDFFMNHLKPAFSGSADSVDLSLLQQTGTTTLAGTSAPAVSDAALRQVAKEANVEVFSLVHATESNQYTGINIYLDEIGMLKRLPLNARATAYAKAAGYEPPPQFYGNIFLARVKKLPGRGMGAPVQMFQSLVVGPDTDMNSAPWIKQAAEDNLNYQMELNRITGQSNLQPSVDGADGKAKKEESFSWTQTEEELEVVVPLPTVDIKAKQVDVKFRPQSLHVTCQGSNVLVALQLFERVDVDSCTWTIDRQGEQAKLVVTMEKMEGALWPRIKD